MLGALSGAIGNFLSPHGGHLKCGSEKFGPSKFRGEEIWLYLESSFKNLANLVLHLEF